jgi:hypothetical protein
MSKMKWQEQQPRCFVIALSRDSVSFPGRQESTTKALDSRLRGNDAPFTAGDFTTDPVLKCEHKQVEAYFNDAMAAFPQVSSRYSSGSHVVSTDKPAAGSGCDDI